MEIAELPPEIYTAHDVVEWLTKTVNMLHHIGTNNPLLTDEQKVYLQYAHDVLKASRNAHVEMAKQEKKRAEQTVIVTAKKGDMVRARSSLRFQDEESG